MKKKNSNAKLIIYINVYDMHWALVTMCLALVVEAKVENRPCRRNAPAHAYFSLPIHEKRTVFLFIKCFSVPPTFRLHHSIFLALFHFFLSFSLLLFSSLMHSSLRLMFYNSSSDFKKR